MPPKSKRKGKVTSKTRKLSPRVSATRSPSSEQGPSHAATRLTDNIHQEANQREHTFSSADEDTQSQNISEDDPEGDHSEEEEEGEYDDTGIDSHTTASANEGPSPIQPQRSQSYGPGSFVPPFYNRPPTPLPPSPSLTSLLRPRSFNASLSRTTTPESSDTEATSNLASPAAMLNSTEAAVARSAKAATTVPRASPKVPTYEYYGFVLYIGSSAAFLVYLLWSYLPATLLHKMGIYYYPNRWWSLAIPAWLIVLVIYIYIALAAWNTGHMTLPLDSLECLVDEKAQIAVIDEEGEIERGHSSNRMSNFDGNGGYGRAGIGEQLPAGAKGKDRLLPDLDWEDVWNISTDGVMDIPIGGVCEILYGSSREQDDD